MRQSSRALGWRPEAALGLLFVVVVALRAFAALSLPTPWLLPDEGAYTVFGPSKATDLLYPVVAGLPYGALRVVQTVVVCATAGVVFVWARSLVRPWAAFAAGALTLALPGLVYGGTIVPAALFLPLATLAGLLGMRIVAAPSLRKQAEFVAVFAVCALTSGEANVVALGVFVAAAALRRVRVLWRTWVAVLVMCGVWAGVVGAAPLRSLGGVGTTSYTSGGVFDFVLEHAGELVLVCGVVPVCAVVLLALARPADRAVRATVAYTLSLAVAAVIEVGAFAAGHAGELLERDLLVALPPILVSFVVWLDRGAPRPRVATLGVAVVVVALLVAEPFGRLIRASVAPDNPTLVALTHLDSAQVYGVVAACALVGGALLVVVRAGRVWFVAALLVGVFAAASVSASEEFVDRAQAARSSYTAQVASWLDDRGGPVMYLYDGLSPWQLAWEQLYWNRRVAGVLDLPATRVPGPMPQSQLQLFPNDGALRLVGGGAPSAGLIAAPSGFQFVGRRLATSPRLGLSLWMVDSPPRVRTWVQGLLPSGDIAEHSLATLEVFNCGRGTFHLVAIGRSNETVRLLRGGTQVATTTLWPDGVWEQTIPTPAAAPGTAGRCTFTVSSTSVVQLTSFSWSPS